MIRVYLAIWLVLVGMPVLALGPDWPGIRGANQDARIDDLDLSLPWPETGPPVLWRAKLGQGYSSFAIVGNRAYTQAQSPAGQFVVCIDMGTGEVIWRSRYGRPWSLDRQWPGPYATPAYYQGRVYFAGCHGTVGCMDGDDGSLRWKVDAMELFQGRGSDFGYACSPLIEDGKVILPIGGSEAAVVALDAVDGSVVWTTGSDPAGYTPAYAITVEGRRQIVSLLQTVLVAHDPASGRELWRHELHKGYNPHPAWPLWEPPYLFTAFAFRRGAMVLQLSYDGDTARAEPRWSSGVISNDIFSSVVVNGHVYGFNIHDPQSDSRGTTKGELVCLELATGSARWSTPVVGHAAVLASDEHLLLVNENGELVVAAADPYRYRELARATILPGELSWTIPSISNQRLLLRSQQQAACVYLGDPDLLNRATIDPMADSGREDLVTAWVIRHYGQAFWAPTLTDLLLWFGLAVAIAAAAGLLALPLRHQPGLYGGVFMTLAISVAAAGTLIFTEPAGRLLLTWPALLFLVFLLAYQCSLHAVASREPRAAIRARLAILLLVAVCGGYFTACQHLSIISGWGFLAGFLPAWPLTHRLARQSLDRVPWPQVVVTGLLAFTTYFWASTLVFTLKAGLL
jgi:outer membrane protein assembly factor BamB